jgi:DNA polymerase
MGGIVILDIETRSTVDLRKVGVARYASHPGTDVWCVAFAVDDGPVQLWLPGDPVPAAIATADVIVAHNAGFERAIFQHILVPRYGWPDIPLERWRCTMAMALALALPASLAQVAAALALPEQKANKAIVTLMAKPRQPRGDENPAAGPYWHDDAEHLQALYDYCRQDVETERALYRWLPPLIPAEQDLWQLDQTVNDRGFYCDGGLITAAIAISAAADRELRAEFQQLTGLNSPSQVEKLIAWLAAHGCTVADLQKGTLRQALRRKELTPEARRAIELRLEAAHASASKMQALQTWRGIDGRVRGVFGFHGAGTGRWTSHGVQAHNLKREVDGIAAKFDAIMSGDLAIVKALGSPIEIAGDVARATIAAPPGHKLLVADYSAIESRVLAWITDEQSKLALWARFDQTGTSDADPYVIIGRSLGFPEETARAYGKIADLAFGYGGGVNAYKNFMPTADNTPDPVIDGFKRAWRERHPQTVQFWHGIERAAIAAIHREGEAIRYGRLTLQCRRLHGVAFLFITLPSGRALSYPFARVIATLPRGTPAVSFMDNAILTGGWTEYRPGRGMWGGGFTENIVQAIARDLLAAAMTRLEAAGYPVVLHVHDAIVCEVPDGAGNV